MDAVALFRVCSEASRVCAKYNLTIDEDSASGEVLTQGNLRYKEVKRLLTICKGLEMLYRQIGAA